MSTDSPPSFGQMLKKALRFTLHRYQRLHIYGKIFLWLVALFYLGLGVLIIILTPSRIAQYLYDHARMLAEFRFGWLVLSLAIVGISFPPLVGHTTLVTLCGFAYGMKGVLISLPASVLGAAIVFSFLRLVFKTRLQNWAAKNEKWQALEAVVREKGLLLIILIRVSPFPPWVYSNALFASIESVALWQFVTATLFISPKLLLHTFIGSRLAALSDGDQREHMDTQTIILNGLFITAGVCIAIFTSWWIYKLVQDHISHADGVPPEVRSRANEALEELDEEAPLLPSFDDHDSHS